LPAVGFSFSKAASGDKRCFEDERGPHPVTSEFKNAKKMTTKEFRTAGLFSPLPDVIVRVFDINPVTRLRFQFGDSSGVP
jgi:hypothetical protein